MWPEELPLTFRADGSTSVNYRLLPMQPGDFLSSYVNFRCSWETFRQPPSTLCVARVSFGNFPCDWETFHQLPSTFCADRTPSDDIP